MSDNSNRDIERDQREALRGRNGEADAAGPAVTLDYCLIEASGFEGQRSAVARLYVNGRQETELVISLRALDGNGEVTSLPADTRIDIVPVGATTTGLRVSSTPSADQWTPFDESAPGLLPAVYAPQQKSGAMAEQYFNRFVIFDSVQAGKSIKFIVKVTLANGVTFTTDATDVAYGGAGEFGRFNSNVYIKAVQPLFYQNSSLVVSAQPYVERVVSAGDESRTARIIDTNIALLHPATLRSVNARLLPGRAPAEQSSCHYNKATANAFAGTIKKNVPSANTMGKLLDKALALSLNQRPHEFCVVVASVAYNAGMFSAPQESFYVNGCDEFGNAIKLRVFLESTNPVDNNNPWTYSLIIESVIAPAQADADD